MEKWKNGKVEKKWQKWKNIKMEILLTGLNIYRGHSGFAEMNETHIERHRGLRKGKWCNASGLSPNIPLLEI